MNRTICQLALKESGMYITPVILVLLACILFKQDPLRYFELIVGILSCLLGFFLAWRSFADYGNVRAFLFSRPWSPKRFFLVRWLFGLSVIGLTALVIALLLILGIRQAVQQLLFENGWYPMIRFSELRILMSFVILSLLTYNTTLYFILTNRFRGPLRLRGLSLWLRRIGTVLLIMIGIVIALTLGFWGALDLIYEPGYPIFFIPFLYLIFGMPALIQTALMPWFGIYCYNNQEIES